jgi:tetratricopeptide (TPR) repeat protein
MSETVAPQLIGRIAALARGGRLAEASALAANGWKSGGDDPVLAALAGTIELHRGDFARAADYLRFAHDARPSDVTIRTNLAEALYHMGRTDAVLALCDEPSMAADASLRLARLAGYLHQEAGSLAEAVACYRRIVDREPGDWGAWNNLGNSLAAKGDTDDAIAALQKARDLAPDSPPILLNLANALMDAGRGDDAEAVLKDAAAQFPDDPQPWLALHNLYQRAGLDEQAFDAISGAAERAPGDAQIWSDRGLEAAQRNRYDIAETSFETALAIEPALGPSLVGLASVYERVNREAEFDGLYERATAAGADEQSLSFIDALRFRRAGRFQEAYEALERAPDVIVTGRMHYLRGSVLDRLGRADEAFADFASMNEHWKADPSRPLDRAAEYRRAMTQASALLSGEWLAGWGDPPAHDPVRRSPVFLVGFPRSGTTLLDTMLMADPSVLVLEEEPFLVEAETDLGGIEALPAASAAELAAARERYFEKIDAKAGPIGDRLVIDKHPMHLNKVAIARRLFPDARFILALRHPCDCLLSCYITNFRINSAMASFLDLDDAASLYDLSFEHWQKALKLFDLPVREVVYERLVHDRDGELRPLFEWLGLAWPDDGVDHRDIARRRGTVITASYSQVTEPLYSRSAGRWARYRKHLEPILPLLEPWIERFGYSLDDGRAPARPRPGPDDARSRQDRRGRRAGASGRAGTRGGHS